LLALWEQLGLPYVVVAELCEPIKNLLRRGGWQPAEVAGTEVAEIERQAARWPHARHPGSPSATAWPSPASAVASGCLEEGFVS
jgi:hypothetical protein